MALTVIGLLRFGFSLLFGMAVSVLFAGIEINRKNKFIIGLIFVTLLFLPSLFFENNEIQELLPHMLPVENLISQQRPFLHTHLFPFFLQFN